MSYRYTFTEKWNDAWYSNLKPEEKLLFNYLTDNCDIAGFIEVNIKRWSSDIGWSSEVCEGALKGLQRGFIYSESMDCIYIRNFLKHQKNIPLNPEKNMAHRGIIKRFELYKYKFDIQDITNFIEGAMKGLRSPYGIGIGIGIGIGNGIGNGIGKEEGQIQNLKPEEGIITMRRQCAGNAQAMQSKVKKSRVKKSKEEKSKVEKVDPFLFLSGRNVNELLVKKWAEWNEYRKQLKKPYRTQKGAAAAYNHLLDLSGNDSSLAISIIKQSIENEWQGFFPLKTTNNQVRNENLTLDEMREKFKNAMRKAQ